MVSKKRAYKIILLIIGTLLSISLVIFCFGLNMGYGFIDKNGNTLASGGIYINDLTTAETTVTGYLAKFGMFFGAILSCSFVILYHNKRVKK